MAFIMKLDRAIILLLLSSFALAQCPPNQYPGANGNCLPQSIPNCTIYQPNANYCVACALGFYASNGVCAAQSLPNCQTYQNNQNQCLICATGYYVNGLNKCSLQKR